MRERSITHRNIVGGFIGGMLGILAFAWKPLLLPFGVIAGVLLGFWYEVLWNEIRSINFIMVLEGPRKKLTHTGRWAKRKVVASLAYFKDVLNQVVQYTRVLRQLPKQLAQRRKNFPPAVHPVDRVRVAYILAALVGSIPVVWWTINNPNMPPLFEKDPSGGLISVAIGLAGFMTPIFSIMAVFMVTDDTRSFYRTYDRHQRFGAPLLFLMYLVSMSLTFVGTTILAVLTIAGIFGVMFLTMVWMALMAFVVVLRALVTVSTRKEHVVALSITMVVTLLSAVLSHEYLSGILLWVIALANGCVSGLLSEGVRRVFASYFRRHPEFELSLYEAGYAPDVAGRWIAVMSSPLKGVVTPRMEKAFDRGFRFFFPIFTLVS